MKLVRYGEVAAELPGMIDHRGQLRSLVPLVADINPDLITPEGQAALRAVDPQRLPIVNGQPRLGVPVGGIRQIIAVGLNYTDHASEAGMVLPSEPLLFSKAVCSLSGPDDDILLYRDSDATDWEVELGVIMGRSAESVPEKDALEYVAGYCGVNDVSERRWQLESGGQFFKGKSAPSFCPVGPWLLTADEIKDPQDLRLQLSVNGQSMQDGHTLNMVFSVPKIISYVSRHMKLCTGDLIITGTPAGVGMGMKPPRFLKPGDVVTQTITGLGSQRHRVAVRE